MPDFLYLNSFAHFHFQRLNTTLGEELILTFLMFLQVIPLPGENFQYLTSNQIRTPVTAGAEALSRRTFGSMVDNINTALLITLEMW